MDSRYKQKSHFESKIAYMKYRLKLYNLFYLRYFKLNPSFVRKHSFVRYKKRQLEKSGLKFNKNFKLIQFYSLIESRLSIII